MKHSIILFALTIILFSGVHIFAQDLPAETMPEPKPLTPAELFVLSNIPLLELPDAYKGPDAPLLPVSVDNSTKKYFRSITNQSGYECGQSSGIAFNFTYEIDRLRNLAANQPATTYPTHFTWDFLNNGENYQGASFFDSWEIVRACGNMNVEDYGGTLDFGGYKRWISGYNVYYNGMKNRLNSVKAIRCDTPEGIMTLKYWIYDHIEGSAIGGVGNIYGSYFCTPSDVLPPNTPEAGKYVQTFWGSHASHGYTVCGYNDSIRFDFNNDGQYTNNLDINGDGVVDVHDWEMGGVKFSNGYSGPGCSNLGFCYTMYKNLADAIEIGGIWNHTIYVIDVKEACFPPLTMKITLKHTSRNKLKVTAGISTDLNATTPSYVQDFPIFNYQGGDYYMQGGSDEAAKTIEFGLDLAPLCNQITSGQPAKYFLQVQEKDPGGLDAGEIVGWSLIDYTGDIPVITSYPSLHTAIQNNTTTRLGLNYTLTFEQPEITTDTLPPAPLYQPYDVTLSASGGSAPYLWDAKLDYPESISTASFPAITAEKLTLTNNNSGYAVKNLDFNFPFFKKMVSKIYVYADGFILFDDQPYEWPYLIDGMLLFKETGILSPFMTDLNINASGGQGIWYEGTTDYAIFRWKASIYNMQGTTNLNFAVKLFPNGTIEFYYGEMVYSLGVTWTGGISGGDNKNYQFSLLNNGPVITTNTLDKFSTCSYPTEMQITEDGHFTGTPSEAYQNRPIKFRVTDNNNITAVKTLLFGSSGLFVTHTISSGGDSLIEYGDTAHVNLQISNIGTQAMHNITISVTGNDPFITLADTVEFLSVINGGETLLLDDVFNFLVAPNIPDRHSFRLTMSVVSDEVNFIRTIGLTAHAPLLQISQTLLVDGDNGMLDPGETADLLVTYKNSGSAKASGIEVELVSLDSALTITPGSGIIGELKPDSSFTLTLQATASHNASFEHLYQLRSALTASNNFSLVDTLFLLSGQILEDFETGTMLKFPWIGSGQWPWHVASNLPYEGIYSCRSGGITDNAESILTVGVQVLTGGEISFWKYVSCEHDPSGNLNYDWLSFSIDGFELGRWDGEITWSKETYSVMPGFHTFSWVYHKDYSVSTGYDGALIDFLQMPLIDGALPQLSVNQASFEKSLVPGQSTGDSFTLTNLGGGILEYSVIVMDTTANADGDQVDNLNGSSLTCATSEFVPGQAFNWILTAHNTSPDNEYIRDIKLEFPEGMTVSNASNFSGGSLGELVLQEEPGSGTTMLNWHGESSGGRGVLKPGEYATAYITGTITGNFMNDIFMVYDLGGDSIGGAPHHQAGHIRVMNSGLFNNWLTAGNTTGILMHDQSATIPLDFDATDLNPGTYHCCIIARDYFNNKIVIPVTLNVAWPVAAEEPGSVGETRLTGSFPNPFSEETRLHFKVKHATAVSVTIYNMQGMVVRTLCNAMMPAGDNTLVWDGRDVKGNRVAAGIYTCQMKTADYSGSVKMIVIR